MYVITFYSFKGGVGRTMALVNVAAELVRRGRKVLVVDFDLEAPGLETYKHLSPPKPHPGIVEYVTEYRRTNVVPDLREYVYETKPIGKKGGRLWVMPAGRRDAAYRSALAKLDWQRLYREEEGFLLFEDTKKGWEEELNPDYVLIDSRTGDTDILGICTRQLPDSVVLMFTPNEQNLAGLENVCRDIRREETEGLKKTIRLHFVAANVPDLDDENRILRRQMQAFRERLDFKDLSGVILRYENLNLLDQSVFTLDRPHTRLARSYRRLVRRLIKDNFADREGAMTFLEEYARLDPESRPPDKSFTPQEFAARFPEQVPTNEVAKAMFARVSSHEYDEPFNEIIEHFFDDVEVLGELAKYCTLKENYEDAVYVLDRALQLQPDLPDSWWSRALCKIELNETKEAVDDLLACLRQSDHDSDLVERCLKKLREIAPHRLSEAADILSARGFPGLSARALAEFLCDTEATVPRAAQLLREFLANSDDAEKESESGKLVELLLRARCWNEVIRLLEGNGIEELNANQLFRLALAYWGEKGDMPETLCRLALERKKAPMHSDRQLHIPETLCQQTLEHGMSSLLEFGDPVYGGLQAMSWLHWRVGNDGDSIRFLKEAEEFGCGEDRDVQAGKFQFRLMRHIGRAFSLWRYRFVSVEQFLDDCRLMRRMIQGEPLRPAFLGPAAPTAQV